MDDEEDLLKRIEDYNRTLLPGKVQRKYALMCENPYRFFRGTCHLFFEDLAQAAPLPPSPAVWISGDLHMENLGTYKGDNRLVYFDLNDFDEALLGPANWELARMIASIFVVSDQYDFKENNGRKLACLFLTSYFKTLADGRAKYIEPRTAQGIVKKFLQAVSDRKQKDLMHKLVTEKKGKIILKKDDNKYIKLPTGQKEALIEHVQTWLKHDDDSPYNFKVLDACFRQAGTGSLGVNRFLFLLQSKRQSEEYLFLDMKQATPPAALPYITVPQPIWNSDAERTINIQKRSQNVSPALLSSTDYLGHSYVVQEMQPVEDKVNFNRIKENYRDVCEVITAMAELTASSHLRSCSRQGSATADELLSFGSSAQPINELVEYGEHYARKVKKDFITFTGLRCISLEQTRE